MWVNWQIIGSGFRSDSLWGADLVRLWGTGETTLVSVLPHMGVHTHLKTVSLSPCELFLLDVKQHERSAVWLAHPHRKCYDHIRKGALDDILLERLQYSDLIPFCACVRDIPPVEVWVHCSNVKTTLDLGHGDTAAQVHFVFCFFAQMWQV